MNRLFYVIMAAAAVPAVLSSCSDDVATDYAQGGGTLAVNIRLTADGDSEINGLTAYRFSDGVLEEVLAPQGDGSGGSAVFSPAARRGTMYFVANPSGVAELSAAEPGVTAEADFTAMMAHVSELTSGGLLMTGKTVLSSETPSTVNVDMLRAVARIDLNTPEAGVEVLSVRISGLAGRGYVFPQTATADGLTADTLTFTADYSGSPLAAGRYLLLYVPEQNTAAGALVEIDARLNGALHRLRVSLPQELERNNVYTVQVRGNGAELAASVVYGGWESGGVSGSAPRPSAAVDESASTLGPGVRLSADRDTVYFPYTGGSWRLALHTKASAAVSVEGSVDGFTVAQAGSATTISVTGGVRLPGTRQGMVWLNVSEGGVNTGRITLVFDASPVHFGGMLELDGSGVCDLGRYADGELGTVEIPAGKTLTVSTPPGEPWMKADLTARGGQTKRYRIIGGWRPNDPTADGRVQEARIVITDDGGSNREEYTVRRRNWGLPVVRIGQTWWAKYNLRGNARSFSDQITCADDPAAGRDIMEVLATAQPDVLLRMMGDQYQAGFTGGLPLRHDGQDFYHEGMRPSGHNFGTVDPASMAPDGYRVPGYDDYAWLSANDNHNIGGTGTRTYTNRHGNQISVTIAERDADFLGHNYGTVAFYAFDSEGSRLALFGLGHQWQTAAGNIARMHLLLATHGNPDQTWVMEGYAAADRPGQNWLKFTPQNHIKTRTIRCVKTPVEYIY